MSAGACLQARVCRRVSSGVCQMNPARPAAGSLCSGGGPMSPLPGYRCSIGARWGRRSSPPGCWPRPPAAPTPAGKAPGPALKRTSTTTGRKRRMTRTTDGWKT